jgi:hypothetical protein
MSSPVYGRKKSGQPRLTRGWHPAEFLRLYPLYHIRVYLAHYLRSRQLNFSAPHFDFEKENYGARGNEFLPGQRAFSVPYI